MPATDLPLLIEAARAAGEIALTFSGPTARRWEKDDDAGPVTEADLAVNAMLETRLQLARPDYGWLSEETEDNPDRLSRDRVFIVDPIDGTRSFVEGADTWAHALAVSHNNRVTAAVIYLPARDLLYSAALGQGAFLNGVAMAASDTDNLARAEILTTRAVMDKKLWANGLEPPFQRAYRPSLAYRMALVAEGQFDGMITLRPSWEWDIAAGDLIMREAGGVCTDRTGGRLRFNNPVPKQNGLIAAGAAIHAHISSALKPV